MKTAPIPQTAIVALWAALPVVLAGCATTAAPDPGVRVVEVRIPVPVPCVVDVGPDPQYPDSPEAIEAAPDMFARVKLLLAARVLRIAREAELKAAMAGCGSAPAS